MAEVAFKVRGLRELDARLNRIALKSRAGILTKALDKAATPIVDESRQNVVSLGLVKHGRLARRINAKRVRPKRANNYTAAVHISATRQAFYGLFHELGTSLLAARPFLRPAFDSKVRTAINIFKTELFHLMELRDRRKR